MKTLPIIAVSAFISMLVPACVTVRQSASSETGIIDITAKDAVLLSPAAALERAAAQACANGYDRLPDPEPITGQPSKDHWRIRCR